jgi:cytosine/adenosine deaminase-related metal-dependent hydrolase
MPSAKRVAGLIDAHCHGPQYRNAGTGTDLPLLEWLERYSLVVARVSFLHLPT